MVSLCYVLSNQGSLEQAFGNLFLAQAYELDLSVVCVKAAVEQRKIQSSLFDDFFFINV